MWSIAAVIIGSAGRQVTVVNAYNKWKVYSIYPEKNSELYVSGLIGGIAVVDNFYNSGSVRLKAGNMKEINGEDFTNIRPGEGAKSFNYSYWASGILLFP